MAGVIAAAPIAAVAVPAFADAPSAAPVDWHDHGHDHDGWHHHHDNDRNGPWQPGGFNPGAWLPGPPPTGSFG